MIARRFSGSSLVHLPDDAEIKELCKFVTMIPFLSFNEIVQISGSSQKDEFINKLYGNIEEEYFK